MGPAARFHVRVQPRARGNTVQGWDGDVLRLRVTAPPADGEANAAVVGLLAEALGVAKSAVTVVRGHANRDKLIAVQGLTLEEVRRRVA